MEFCASAWALCAEDLKQFVEGFVSTSKLDCESKFSEFLPQNIELFPLMGYKCIT